MSARRTSAPPAPRERPIIFTGESVRGILAGRKTVTRRVVKPQPHPNHVLSPAWGTSPDGFAFGEPGLWRENGPDYPDGPEDERRCPYGVPGDLLWVRETWRPKGMPNGLDGIHFRADDTFAPIDDTREAADAWVAVVKSDRGQWRSPLFMPRWASRLSLEVVSVRVERLHQITEQDAILEGVLPIGFPRDAFTAVFAIGRVGGWIPHAREQALTGKLIRPKSVYVGPGTKAAA